MSDAARPPEGGTPPLPEGPAKRGGAHMSDAARPPEGGTPPLPEGPAKRGELT